MKGRVLLVLGMHRSGTSVLTSIIATLGVGISRDLLGSDANNEAGYWESYVVNRQMERLLKAAGSSWHDWRPLDLSSVPAADLEAIRGVLVQEVRARLDADPVWVLKDPRNCRAVPLWKEIVDEAGGEPLFLLAVRRPSEVAASLARRDDMPREKALMLWARHVLDAEYETRGEQRATVSHDALMEDWHATLKPTFETLGIPWPDDARERADDRIREDLRHNRSDAAESGFYGGIWKAMTRPMPEERRRARLDVLRAELERRVRHFAEAPREPRADAPVSPE